MAEIAESDGGRIAVPGDSDGQQGMVGQVRAGGDRRHSAVNGIEAERLAQKISRRFRRAADAAKLDDFSWVDAALVIRALNRRRNRVMTAAPAHRRGRAVVVFFR